MVNLPGVFKSPASAPVSISRKLSSWSRIGVRSSTAVNIFLREADRMAVDAGAKGYSSVDELFADLDA